jgi:IS30 family transposase
MGSDGRHCVFTLDKGYGVPRTRAGREATRCEVVLRHTVPFMERGANPNTNGLIGQYLPKGTCMKTLTQAECNWIANELNNRLRERRGFGTPAKVCRPGRGVALQR